MQTKRQSIIESSLNVFSGMVVAFAFSQAAHIFEPQIQKYIWKGFEWHISAGSNVIMTTILTAISVIRGYAWRRHFNRVNADDPVLKSLFQQRAEGPLFKSNRRHK